MPREIWDADGGQLGTTTRKRGEEWVHGYMRNVLVEPAPGRLNTEFSWFFPVEVTYTLISTDWCPTTARQRWRFSSAEE